MKCFVATALLSALCLAQLSGAACGFGKPWKRDAIKAKYGLLPINSYFDLPKTTTSAANEYVKIDESDAQLAIPATLWCHPNDPRVCLIMDNAGNNIGTQITFLDSDIAEVEGYDYSKVNAYTRTNILGKDGYSFRVFYTNPEKLTEAGRPESDDVIDGLYAYINGELVEAPLEDPKVEKSGHFNRQACFPQMGQHYFYEMAKNQTDCSQHVPFFTIYHNGGLVGFGIANFGKASSAENGGRDWYETVPLMGAKLIMPNRPACIDPLITKNGLYSLHVYFVQNPYLISCLFQ